MTNINITNSIVNIYDDEVSKAKDKLLEKMYYARYKNTMGDYKMWLELIDMYYSKQYNKMIAVIKSCHGKGGKTRNDCIDCLNVIMKGGAR